MMQSIADVFFGEGAKLKIIFLIIKDKVKFDDNEIIIKLIGARGNTSVIIFSMLKLQHLTQYVNMFETQE